MELGSKEWFEALEKNVKFPKTVAFYVSNRGKVYSQIVDTKAESPMNIKYEKIQPSLLLSGERTALVRVKRLDNSKEYYSLSKELHEAWGK
ncbi:hypothetical protein CIL05_07705 [Virgibacillus profundi]|uniref:Uncharacterized protein n=1 Tax=Virgibacillus profundi TaxID=2024555 RepID=A0A2A2IFB4_9BACI|nr:hypothetical protein [Virgibacillus profundi]PAV30347.1 hypothetical protein CIL05_07705 [Virgibacillus profundi]PXY54519.1 hypothetical protein CIT14_07790 [Virgibacillus profundi]